MSSQFPERRMDVRKLIISSVIVILASLACGQATQVVPATQSSYVLPTPSPSADTQVAAPILIGTEYIGIENLARVSRLARALEPVGLTAAKPLPDNFNWGNMQSSPEAALDFGKLDNFVREFQSAGFVELVLALKSNSPWASKSYPGNTLLPLIGGVKPEYLDTYETWVFSVVERYDADGNADMPGLLYPIHFYEIGVEFSSYEPEPVEEYLILLERAYRAAHRAYDDVIVSHVAFLTTPALAGPPVPPADYEAAFQNLPDETHNLADMRKILDYPELFDMLNIHSLGDNEIEGMVTWLNYEMGLRGYQKRIIISDTATTPFISWGPATVCDRGPNLMGRIIPPATEADRCRLAEYFTRLVDGDEATVRWTQTFAAQDMAKKVVVSAEQKIALIDTAFTEDLTWLKLPIAQAGAGTSPWAGMVSLDPPEKRAGYYALQQLIGYLAGYESITRLPYDDPGLRVYEVARTDGRTWIAWYDPGVLVLPGDPVPEMILQLDIGGATTEIVVESLITEFGQVVPDQEVLSTPGGAATLTISPVPVFIFSQP